MRDAKPIKLKVCGMRLAENIRAVADLHPDYMGFIFYKGSKRFVGDDFAVPLEFPASIKRVGVFVNETAIEILHLAKKHSLDFIQLHGDETVELCNELRATGLKIVKAFGISEGFDFKRLDRYKGDVDYFLFDTKSTNFGGTGVAFDWGIFENYGQEVPFFLSGGISPNNIADVEKLKAMNLHALDVNSGVEIEVGVKDVEKIRNLKINNLRRTLKSRV